MVTKGKSTKLLALLATWIFLLWVGIMARRAASHDLFDFSWVWVPASVLCLFSIRRNKGEPTRKLWLWALIAIAASLLAAWRTGSALTAFLAEATSQSMAAFGLSFCSFAVVLIVWIALFPFEEVFGPLAEAQRAVWKSVFSVAGAVLAATTIYGTVQRLHGLDRAEAVLRIQVLQSWMQSALLLVFICLITKTLLPTTFYVAAGSLPSKEDQFSS